MIARLKADGLMRDGLMVLVAMMTANVAAALYQFAMMHNLTVELWGELSALLTMSNLAILPGTILNTVIAKFAVEASACADPGRTRALARFVAVTLLWMTVGYVVFGAIFALPIANFLHVPAWAVLLSLVVTAVLAFSAAGRAFAQGGHDFVGYSVATVVDAVGRPIFGVLLVVLGFGIAGALGGSLVAALIGLAYIAARVAPVFRTAARSPLAVDWRRVGATMYGSMIATVCIMIWSNADVQIVKHFFDPYSAGIYGAISLDGKILFFLVSFAPALLLPRVVAQLARGESTRGTLFRVLGLVVAMLVVVMGVFALAPRLIIDVLSGSKYAAAAPYLLGYATAMALLGVTNLLAIYAIAIHRMAFGIPLLAVSLAGLGTLWLYHPSIGSVVWLMVIINAVALLAVAIAVALGGPTATAALEPVAVPPVP